MMELTGRYNTAKVFTDIIDETAICQINAILDQPFAKDSKIRIMPDVHAGAGCTIGTTMTIKDKIVPYMVGVDVGCGVLCCQFPANTQLDFDELDKVIRERVPSGLNVHNYEDYFSVLGYARDFSPYDIARHCVDEMVCKDSFKNIDRLYNSIGTLGGGNHFIEIDKDDDGYFYLVIHTGSRNLGKQVAEIYQRQAINNVRKKIPNEEIAQLIAKLKTEDRLQEISGAIQKYKHDNADTLYLPEYLCYIEGFERSNYLADMVWCNTWASMNRLVIAIAIADALGFDVYQMPMIETVHNYIDTWQILRKGAVDASKGKKLVIPINMRDGTLVCTGKGNPDWNYSAPHGAGRIMSRSEAKSHLSLDEYQDSMSGVYTTCVSTDTIDEAPMAYKRIQDIVDNIQDTVTVEKIIRPVYNFKTSE